MAPDIPVRPEVVNKLQNTLKDSSYTEALEQAATFNKKLMSERKTRLPFLDSQTGVAQSDCFLWMKKWERMPGKVEGQLYTYPARRWKKRRRQYLLNENYLTNRPRKDQPSAGGSGDGDASGSGFGDSFPCPPISNNNNTTTEREGSIAGNESRHSTDKFDTETRDAWYAMEMEGTEDFDTEDFDDPPSDYDDYEEYGSRKKKKPKKDAKRKRVEYADSEKPFACDLCGARYKTRPGLSYHYNHTHQQPAPIPGVAALQAEDEDSNTFTPPHPGTPVSSHQVSASPAPSGSVLAAALQRDSPLTAHVYSSNSQDGSNPPPSSSDKTEKGQSDAKPIPDEKKEKDGSKSASPSPYCDFCLGDCNENKKTNQKEEMVSCADCGRSAHPSCLQFTANMILSVKKYSWQCIECKTCAICGTSDNDDQLLFCDDCDRGYHMYCLSPPLDEPPEGSWSCVLCIREYHTPAPVQEVNIQPNVEPQPEAKVEPKPEAKVEPIPETKVEPPPVENVEPLPETKVEPLPEAKVQSLPEAKVKPISEARVEPVSEVRVEPVSEVRVEPVSEARVDPPHEAKVEPLSETQAESQPETQIKSPKQASLELPKRDEAESSTSNVPL